MKIAGLPKATGLAFKPDGQTIAVAVQDGPIELWGLTEGRGRQKAIGGNRADQRFLVFTADGKRLLDYSVRDGAYRTGLLDLSGKNLWGGQFGVPAALASDGRHVAFLAEGRALIVRIPKEVLAP